VLLPPIIHGYTPHHMDFPGPITIGWETFVKYAVDIGTSLARHGFKRILYLNGHGSNIPLIDMAARLVGLEHPDVLAAAAFYLTSEEGKQVVEMCATRSGGMGHACELETSIYLAIDPGAVFMDKAVDENSFPEGTHSHMDWSDGPLASCRGGTPSATPAFTVTRRRRRPTRANAPGRGRARVR